MFSTFSRSVSLITLSLLISPLSHFQATARWLTEDEADIECIDAKVVCHIMKDGSWTVEDEIHLRALTEAGREALALKTFAYDATRCSFNILEARVSNEGEDDHIVSREQMEDKKLASDPLGLSNTRQVLVPFGHVGIGSIVHFKAKRTEKSLFEGYFAHNLTFDELYNNQLVRNKEVHIESEIPLFFEANDPRQVLEIHESKDEVTQKQILDIKLKKPLLEETVDESEHSYDTSSLFTSVSLSTERDYARINKFETDLYRSVLAEPLPEKLEEIRQQASAIQDEVACVDTVVSSLIKKLQYLGSWNTEMGGWAPLSLEKSMATGKVDCKGFSSCLAATLNKIEGYKAQISLVQRGEIYDAINLLPSEENTNHVIVKVIAPSGQTYWVDPTNPVSMASGIFPDIADRPVHVLDLETPTDEHIPAINYRRAQIMAEQIITIEGRNRRVGGTFFATGEAAMPLIQGLIRRKFDPVASLKSSFNVADPINPMAQVLTPKELSNVVKPVTLVYSFGQNHFMSRSTKGCSYPLIHKWALPYIMVSQEDVGGIHVGSPSTAISNLVFRGQSIPQEELSTLAFSIETPWLNVIRNLSNTPEGVLVQEKVEILKSTISAEERKSKDFINLQNRLREDYADVSIIFSDLRDLRVEL